ncbi:ankyrin repeat and SOCS box protein 5-like [Branchiostoma floridae]|uniref:Ankyrin repeat and SOCS box protein 5-like n=1 Tax=Branchiostoma floridae TaxID=7739 RepID=A0A9J7MLQ8_BRAFL|nr:ankyrin repeat and SOCS box protein 5-like [Branchiostoma floridae]
MDDAKKMVQAAMNGDTQTVRRYLDKGVDINASWNHRTALLVACRRSKADTVQFLLSAGADVNHVPGIGHTVSQTALIQAAEEGQPNIINLLLSHGADVNKTDRWRYSALLSAASKGHVTSQEILIENGANVDQMGIDMASALHCVTGEELTMKDADPYRISTEDFLRLCRSLMRAGANPNIGTGGVRGTPVHVAARGDHAELTRLLLEAGADMNAVDSLGKKPVDVAPSDSATRALLLSPSPLTLCQLCRLVVWNSLGKGRLHAVDRLNIPSAHKAFLQFV